MVVLILGYALEKVTSLSSWIVSVVVMLSFHSFHFLRIFQVVLGYSLDASPELVNQAYIVNAHVLEISPRGRSFHQIYQNYFKLLSNGFFLIIARKLEQLGSKIDFSWKFFSWILINKPIWTNFQKLKFENCTKWFLWMIISWFHDFRTSWFLGQFVTNVVCCHNKCQMYLINSFFVNCSKWRKTKKSAVFFVYFFLTENFFLYWPIRNLLSQ